MDEVWRIAGHESPIINRPAVAAAGLFAGGVLAHSALPHQPLLWISVIAVSCLVAAGGFRRARLAGVAIAVGLAAAGVLAAQLERNYFPPGHISLFAGERPRLAEIEIRISEPPRIIGTDLGGYRAAALPPKQIVTADARRVRTWDGWEACSGEILLQIGQPHPRLTQGQVVRVLGLLQRPGEAMNPGQFDWANHYRDQRIIATLHAPHADNLRIIDNEQPSILSRAREHVRRVLAMGFDSDDTLNHALLRALLLGDRDTQLRDVQEQFKRTGTGHHLAISGLHVAVLGFVVLGICRLLCLGPRTSVWIGLIFVIIYGAIALPSPPVVRSVLLCGFFAIGIVQRRTVDAVQLLAMSVLAMLIYHPLDLYNAGFQLSFITVLGLALFTGRAIEFLNQYRSVDDLVLASLVPPTRWQAFRRRARAHGIEVLAAGGVAWVVSAPLIALHFDQLNPWAIPGSIVLAPIVFCALIGGMLKIMLTILWPSLAPLWADLAAAPIAWMRWIVDLLAALPYADVPLAARWNWMLMAVYLVPLLMLLRLPLPRFGRWTRVAPTATALMIIPALPLLVGVAPSAQGEQMRITVLAVGAGSCSVIELPRGGELALVDCGSSTLIDLTRKCLGPYLRHHGKGSVDRLYISHANYDHFSAAHEIIPAYDVREIFLSPQFLLHAADNPPAQELLRQLGELRRPATILSQGSRQTLPGGAEMQVLWPPAVTVLSPNDSSLVLRLTFGGRSVLFTGDIQATAQLELLKNPEVLKSDILIAPHHGSMEAPTPDFVRAVDPQQIISSNDRTLSIKQKRFEEAMAQRPLLRTHTSGAVTVSINRDGGMKVTPYRAVEAR